MDHAERARRVASWVYLTGFEPRRRSEHERLFAEQFLKEFAEVAAGAEQRVMACHDCREYREMVAAKLRQAEVERLRTVVADDHKRKLREVIRAEQAEAALAAERERSERLRKALREIDGLVPAAYIFPADWDEQIRACPECLRYKDHPIQLGICDEHRRPLWAREKHDAFERTAIGPRARLIAQAALRDTAEGGEPE